MRKLVLAAVLVLPESGTQASPITGLIAHYEFENNLSDSVGGSTGTGIGAISYDAGVSEQALNLDNGPAPNPVYVNEYARLTTLTLGSEADRTFKLDSGTTSEYGATRAV